MTSPNRDGLGENELFEAFEYLDELRESGRTNMFGAPAYIQQELCWERTAAFTAARLWMDTFSDASASERVAAALSNSVIP